MSGQRAFAQKLNKRPASDIRRFVASTSFDNLPKSISGSNLAGFVADVSLGDSTDPIDFEAYLSEHQNAFDRDPMHHLWDFPHDDVQVHLLRREVRTIAPIVPEHGAEADHHVRNCVKKYTSDYTKVEKRYESFACQHWCGGGKDGTLKSQPKHEYEVDVEDLRSTDTTDSPLQRQDYKPVNGGGSSQRGSEASNIFDLENSQPDSLLPALLDTRTAAEEIDDYNEAQRRLHRQESLFAVYPHQHEEDIIDNRQPAPLPEEHFGHRLNVKCLQLKLELEVEPIFASMALYDAKERKKISENFYFDMTTEQTKKMLHRHIPFQDVSTLSRACVFSVTYPSEDIFLVVKLEKVLQQGDISDAAEPYISVRDEKSKERARQNAAFNCERLGRYRMPFAWTAVYLKNVVCGPQMQEADSSSLDRKSGIMSSMESFRKKSRDDGGFVRHGSVERPRSASLDKRDSWAANEDLAQAYDNFRPVTLTVSSFFKQEADKLGDEDLYKYLNDLKRPSSILKKLKCIPGKLRLDIAPFSEGMKYCLTPELYRVDPYPDDSGRPTKEVVEFPPRHIHLPHNVYRNLLYVYPKYLNFTNRQGSARNIAVKVQFMAGEDPKSALPIIFGKSSCPEYTTEAYTTVTYHSKNPDFCEEIKCRMPAKLTDSHHLLFTFYHVSCQRKVETQPLETPIGYTWLPLLRDNKLRVGDYNLPVSLEEPPPSYSILHPEVQLPSMKWVDNHKGIFTVSVQTVSSLHTLDDHLDHFLTMVSAAEEQKIPPRIGEQGFEQELRISITNLTMVNAAALVHFLPLVLDKLCQLMCRPPLIGGQIMNTGQACFEAMAHIVRRVQMLPDAKCDQHGRNSLLTQYIEYTCSIPHPESPVMSEEEVTTLRRKRMSNAISLQDHKHPADTHTSPTSPGSSNYATLGRPVSMPVNKANHHRSNSDPDLPGSDPHTPDSEVASLMGGLKNVDRTGSFRQSEAPSYVSRLQGRKLVHEELAYQWVVSCSTKCMREFSYSNAWFFFEFMVKAMGEHLSRSEKLYMPRRNRFSRHFLEDVSKLFAMLTREVVDNHSSNPAMKELNVSLAFFLRDCLSLMDRTFVFQRLAHYCKVVYDKYMSMPELNNYMLLLKLDLYRIVCSHEHFVTLNLPFGNLLTASAPSSPTPSCSSTSSQMSMTSTNTLTDRGMYTELTYDYRAQHFLVGLALSELVVVLSDSGDSTVQYNAINLVRNLLSSHDCDSRYRPAEVRARVAALYLPLVGVVLDCVDQLHDPSLRTSAKTQQPDELQGIDQSVAMAIAGSTVYGIPHSSSSENLDSPGGPNKKPPLNAENTRNLLVCWLWVLKNIEARVLRSWWTELPPAKLNGVLQVLFLCAANFEYKPDTNPLYQFKPYILDESFSLTEDDHQNSTSPEVTIVRPPKQAEAATNESTRPAKLSRRLRDRSLDSLRSQLSNISPKLQRALNSSPSEGKKAAHQYPTEIIQKSANMKTKLEDVILGSGSARSDMMARRKHFSNISNSSVESAQSPASESASQLRWRKDRTQWRQTGDFTGHVSRVRADADAILPQVEGSLGAEANMIVLDTLELIVQIVSQTDSFTQVLPFVLKVLLGGLGLNQSATVLINMFATQRSLVAKFPELLFEEETEQCADLCLRLLRHCSSPIASTRMHASGSLYLLMRHNFEKGNNFARVKMQVTMSLSSLVGQNQSFNEEHLRKSLKTMLVYAEADSELQDTSFPDQVRELVFNLHMILSNTVKMKEFQEDPEMLIDLMFRIAKGYQNSPDLRLTWLQNMAASHSQRGAHAEAAQCLVHSAGLVAEYLNLLEDRDYLPVGCVSFQHISKNVLEESAVSDDVVSPDREGSCTGKYFTELGLTGLLEQAASSFNMAGMYEAVNNVYRVLIPIYEAYRDFKKLAAVHGKLKDAFDMITKQEGRRVFGTYFRVGFYGMWFAELNGQEFIYKEPAITKLPEISHRLEAFYSERFGAGNLEMLKDSNTVEIEKLDPEKAYIQITYVEPYFDLFEYEKRKCFFDLNYGIKRFMFATPFTEDGKAHGDIARQFKRKTILTTTESFPYVKTRLLVKQRHQIILSPIEVAIEDIQKGAKELTVALRQEPPDTKILQMVLQGCIGTTVNQGPLEVAQVFLLPIAEGKEQPTKHHNKLRITFKDLIKKCGDAVHKNKGLIGPDQQEYHRELERNYKNVHSKLMPLISSNIQTGTLKKKAKKDKHHHKEGKSRVSSKSVQGATPTHSGSYA